MNLRIIVRALAGMIFIISLFMLAPIFIAVLENSPEHLLGFLIPAIVGVVLSVPLIILTRKHTGMLSPRGGFLLVSLGWLLVSGFGSLPFVIDGSIPSITDAFFETTSGFTTTGASILENIEALPRPILFWRSLTHWLGGMGIVVLAVALFPLLGIGGLQLMRAEAPGPDVDRLTSRIAGTAKILWSIYLGMTVLEVILLLLGGMDFFHALTHTFGTLATGGFSPKNLSLGHYSNPYLHIVVTVFMVLAGTNFIMHYRLITGRFKLIRQNSELKAYLCIFFAVTILMAINLSVSGTYQNIGTSLRFAGFQTASILTTTGYVSADYTLWPGLSKALLFAIMFVGGCAGSTSGGIKVIRIVALLKTALKEMRLLISPRAVFSTRINETRLRNSVFHTISGFVILYFFFIILTTIVVSAEGYDLLTSLSTALATLGNIGPGFGLVGPSHNYAFYSDFLKWFLSFMMILGRLEIYTILVLFTPKFWHR